MRPSSRVLSFAASLFLCGAVAHGAAIPQRIMVAIDASGLTQLPDNVPAQALRSTDLGLAAPNRALTELSIRFNRTDTQQKALTQLLSDQQNPASPRYHRWLTPEQFGAQFGLAPSDLQKVSAWLTGQGFTVMQVARGSTFIRFSGTVAQAQNAFHTQLHRVSLDGEIHVTNLSSPVLPSAIAGVTSAITGLHDFQLKPRHHAYSPQASDGAPNPAFTSSVSGNHFIAPGDFYTIYDEGALLTSGIDGTGVTIGVLGQVDINLADIATFRSVSGLSVNPPTIMLFGPDPGPAGTRPGGPNNSDFLESELDVEWSGATAPSAKIIFVNATDVINGSLTQAIDNNVAPVLSLSYGACETSVGQSVLNTYDALLQMANAQGQTVVVAAGDSGATDCDNRVPNARGGLVADFPAVLPGVTGIGGTMFNEGSGTFWSTTNGANMGSALSYIPETVWNEDSVVGQLASGGGGASAFFTKPYWQVGTGVPADSSRDVPDISFNAAAAHDPYLICTTGAAGDATAAFCTNGYRNAAGNLDAVGGTSVGAPAFAGVMALVVQKTGGPVGNANPTIYALANSSFYATAFHDITTGNNASPCTVGTTDCPGGGTIGYNAGVGYDLASGWGTLDVFNFVNDWSLVTPLVSTIGETVSSTTLTATPATILLGGTINLTATVVSGSASTTATPTGTVQFLVDNVAFGTPVPLSGNTATFALDTSTLNGGAHNAQAAYSGDSTFAGSKGLAAITVQGPDFTLTPGTTTASVRSGSTAAGITFTVTGINSFAGNVVFSVNTPNGTFTPNPVVIGTANGTGTTVLTITTATALSLGNAQAATRPSASPWIATGSGIALAGILVLVLPRRRRFIGALVAVISVGMLAGSGCGSGTAPAQVVVGAAPGTYALTVTAIGTSGTTVVSHTATINLTVQ